MSKEKKSGLGKFLAGAAIGAGLGILFAPKKGSETRADLKAKIEELVKQVKKIDLESVRKGAEGLQKAIALVQDFGNSRQTNNYQARPLYKHLED